MSTNIETQNQILNSAINELTVDWDQQKKQEFAKSHFDKTVQMIFNQTQFPTMNIRVFKQ